MGFKEQKYDKWYHVDIYVINKYLNGILAKHNHQLFAIKFRRSVTTTPSWMTRRMEANGGFRRLPPFANGSLLNGKKTLTFANGRLRSRY